MKNKIQFRGVFFVHKSEVLILVMSSLKISYFSLIANVQPNLTLPCMVHATQLQNVHQRVGQQTETVQQDLELAVLLRKFSQHYYLSN